MLKTSQFVWSGKFLPKEESVAFSNTKAQLAIMFSDRFQLTEEVLKEAKNLFPNATIVYGSTSGHFSNENVHFESPVITGLEFEKTDIKILEIDTSFLENPSDTSNIELDDLFNTANLKAVFLLSEGNTTNGSELTRTISQKNKNKVPVFGGLTADMERFEKTFAGINTLKNNPRVVVIGFIGNAVHFHFGSEGGWHVFGPERTITSSNKNVLYELNNINALDLYKDYLGEFSKMLPASSLYFPLSVKHPDGKKYFVRTVLSIDENEKSMTFAGDIPQGSTVRFMKSNNDLLLDAAQNAIEKTNKNFNPQLVLLVSCVGRKIVLANRHEEELELAISHYKKQEIKPTVTGFYSYGEIAPDGEFSSCDLYNQTITITSIYEE